MSLIYRKATTKDEKVLFDLSVAFTKFNQQYGDSREQFFYDNWEEGFVEEINESLNDSNTLVYVAVDTEKSDEVIGYCIGRYCDGCFFFAVDELYVVDGYRGQSVGKTLINMTLEEAKKFNCPIRIEVYNWNTNALEMYKKMGFTPTSTVLELYKN